MNSNYAIIGQFGPLADKVTPDSNPLSYCALSELDSGFYHTLGGTNLMGPGSAQCQKLLANSCGEEWSPVCEYLSQDTQRGGYPNTVQACNGPSGSCLGPGLGNALTKGQILIRNAAGEKYLKAMSSNCKATYQPFDPTVANSPLIRSWTPIGNGCNNTGNCYASNQCIPIYGVDPATIDNDPLMNKVLAQPWIAMDILVNMHNNAARSGQIGKLAGTKLGKFFAIPQFQQIVKSGMYKV